MTSNSEQSKERDGALSALNVALEGLSLASSITPAKAVFGSVSIILTIVKVRSFLLCTAMGSRFTFGQDSMMNEQNYVELVLNCADICRALDRGTNGKILDDLSQSVREAINQMTT
jgi:hypothetical protein